MNPILRFLFPGSPHQGLLGEFSFRRAIVPTALFVVILGLFYHLSGKGPALALLVKLWVSFASAYVLLAALAHWKGSNPEWHYIISASVFGVIIGGGLAAQIAHLEHPGTHISWQQTGLEWVTGTAFSAFFICLSLGASIVRNNEQRKSNQREQVLQAQVRALTAQIEPHFLMNTLANLRYLMRKDVEQAQIMLDHMADFFQGALSRARAAKADLGQELDLVQSYLQIMQIRMGNKLQWSINVPAELLHNPFPSLMLQTLVENAVTHGIAPMENTGEVKILSERRNGNILLTVSDNGVGMPQNPESRHGIGLENTRARLNGFFHGKATLAIQSNHSGTTATITVPE
ncbi:histidine kinase [Microbulbifer agarilyticus]|uniref:sensor histidine kinase n=1 Tax=Microbulbifer agarilyticus TaxID=260552 RepID=UPI001C9594D2|nr:histidine kinase [Microbulbifer agarilyticus]MBY6191389.1 histidine kinase [Microbulbifer agarilyticus]